MTPEQLKSILRGALFTVLPTAALQMGCGDPCIGPTTRTPQTATISEKLPNTVAIPLSAEECVKRCRELVEQRGAQRMGGNIEDFTTTTCETKLDNQGEGQIDCNAAYTSVQTSYTGKSGCPVPGRMPTGLHIHEQTASNEIGLYFAHMAAMETAAVTAFRYLVHELEAHQAPEELVQIAREAIHEECQHAEMATLLAQAYDASPPVLAVAPFRLRPLAEIVLENATEGCINETFAAACAMWQQEHTTLDAFRAVIGRIAEEESRHAALSWAIHAWAMPQLSLTEQTQIRQAQAQTLDTLEQHFLEEAPPTVRTAVGLPTSQDAALLFQQLRTQLWEPRIV